MHVLLFAGLFLAGCDPGIPRDFGRLLATASNQSSREHEKGNDGFHQDIILRHNVMLTGALQRVRCSY